MSEQALILHSSLILVLQSPSFTLCFKYIYAGITSYYAMAGCYCNEFEAVSWMCVVYPSMKRLLTRWLGMSFWLVGKEQAVGIASPLVDGRQELVTSY